MRLIDRDPEPCSELGTCVVLDAVTRHRSVHQVPVIRLKLDIIWSQRIGFHEYPAGPRSSGVTIITAERRTKNLLRSKGA